MTELQDKKVIDTEKIKQAVSMIIEAIGDDPNRPGLIETPDRVARYYKEIFEGMLYSNQEIATKYNKCFETDVVSNTDGLVVEKNITVFSTCEHHLALMYDMNVAVGYIPRGKIIGLSKINRICRMCGKRLQLQERLGEDILETMKIVTESPDIAVHIIGKHACVTSRGICDYNAYTSSTTLSGKFKTNEALRSEFYSMLNK